MKFKIAFGTNDGQTFNLDHFGESKFFAIYEINSDNSEIKFISNIKNTSGKENIHADPVKAKSIFNILSGITVLIAFVFGPNILRIRKKFIPVISREKNIKISLNKFKDIISDILLEIKKENKKEDKKIFYIN